MLLRRGAENDCNDDKLFYSSCVCFGEQEEDFGRDKNNKKWWYVSASQDCRQNFNGMRKTDFAEEIMALKEQIAEQGTHLQSSTDNLQQMLDQFNVLRRFILIGVPASLVVSIVSLIIAMAR